MQVVSGTEIQHIRLFEVMECNESKPEAIWDIIAFESYGRNENLLFCFVPRPISDVCRRSDNIPTYQHTLSFALATCCKHCLLFFSTKSLLQFFVLLSTDKVVASPGHESKTPVALDALPLHSAPKKTTLTLHQVHSLCTY